MVATYIINGWLKDTFFAWIFGIIRKQKHHNERKFAMKNEYSSCHQCGASSEIDAWFCMDYLVQQCSQLLPTFLKAIVVGSFDSEAPDDHSISDHIQTRETIELYIIQDNQQVIVIIDLITNLICWNIIIIFSLNSLPSLPWWRSHYWYQSTNIQLTSNW